MSDLRQTSSRPIRWRATAGLQRGLCRAGEAEPRGDHWRWRATCWWRPPMARRPSACSASLVEPLLLHLHMREVLSRVGLPCYPLPRPDMPDEQATVEAITGECVIYGSPSTVLDKLIAFRRARRPAWDAAHDRPRLGRHERNMGTGVHASPGGGGDAQAAPALLGARAAGVSHAPPPRGRRLTRSTHFPARARRTRT